MRTFFKSLREIRKLLRRGSSLNSVVKVCPVCLSQTVEIVPNFLPLIVPNSYHCKTCDYNGPILVEIEKEDYEKIKIEDTSNFTTSVEKY